MLGIFYADGDIQHQIRLYKTDAEGREICSAVVRHRHGVQWLSEVWVSPDARRQGLGTRLVKAVVRWCGHRALYLSVSAYADQPLSDSQLSLWYARFGFVPVGIEAPGLMVRRPTEGSTTCPPARPRRRRHLAERLDAQRRRMDIHSQALARIDQDNDRQDTALTVVEARLLDLEQVVERQATRIRELECQATTALAIGLAAGAGASSSAAGAAGGNFDPCAPTSAPGGAGALGAGSCRSE